MLDTIRSRRDTINFLNNFDLFMKNLNIEIFNHTKIKYRNPFEAVKLPVKVKKGILENGLNFQKESLEKKYKGKIIISSQTSLIMASEFKLIIEFVNGTGFLECLTNNVPVVLVMSKYNNSLNHYAKDFYEKLKKVKIYFEDFVEASNFINKNYSKLNEWWYSKNLQEVRIEFVNIFAKKSNSKLAEVKKAILN
tara:strand:- start:167 stop:748 length:582 start_codon:yes stop_codon:yes gene_type:complete